MFRTFDKYQLTFKQMEQTSKTAANVLNSPPSNGPIVVLRKMVVAPAHRETVSTLLAKGGGFALAEEKNRLHYFCASRRISYSLSTTQLSTIGASALTSVSVGQKIGLTKPAKASAVEVDVYCVWDEYANGAALDFHKQNNKHFKELANEFFLEPPGVQHFTPFDGLVDKDAKSTIRAFCPGGKSSSGSGGEV